MGGTNPNMPMPSSSAMPQNVVAPLDFSSGFTPTPVAKEFAIPVDKNELMKKRLGEAIGQLGQGVASYSFGGSNPEGYGNWDNGSGTGA